MTIAWCWIQFLLNEHDIQLVWSYQRWTGPRTEESRRDFGPFCFCTLFSFRSPEWSLLLSLYVCEEQIFSLPAADVEMMLLLPGDSLQSLEPVARLEDGMLTYSEVLMVEACQQAGFVLVGIREQLMLLLL